MTTTEHIIAEINRQRHELTSRCLTPEFVVLDKLSYLELDMSLKARFTTDPFGFSPSLGHFHKIFGLSVVVIGAGHTIKVVASPYDEAMR